MGSIKRYVYVLLSLAAAVSLGCAPVTANHGYRSGLPSWEDLRWHNIQRQHFDFSCGAAALATISQHYFGDPIDEQMVLFILVNQLTEEGLKDRQENGFSLLDLRLAATKLGYYSAGVILRPQDIYLLDGPIIVVLNDGILDHFVVLKGSAGDTIYLADSARGNIRMPLWRFLGQWKTGAALVLGKPGVGLLADHGLTIPQPMDAKPETQLVRQYRARR